VNHASESAFARWRRTRPFAGGLLLILSGLELLLSGNMDLGNLQLHIGPTGFLSYVIPAMVLLCGALTWLSPGQRLFYGILGTVTAVYSLIGVNFGGFLLGLILGVVGGALTFAWTPSPAPAAVVEAPVEEPEPAAVRSPVPQEDEAPPPSDDDRRGPHLGALIVVALVLAAGFGIANSGTDALAAPTPSTSASASACPSASSPKPSRTTATPASPKPGTSQSPASPSPSPSASPGDGKGRGIVNGIVDGVTGLIDKILGNDGDKADPDPSGSPSVAPSESGTGHPTRGPTKSPSTTATPGRSSSKSASPSASACAPLKAKDIPPDEGQPPVAKRPSTLIAQVQTMRELNFEGIVNLPTAGGGTIRALKFTIGTSTSEPFELRTPVGSKTLDTKSDKLTVNGNVAFYTDSFEGLLIGIIPVHYTPDSPPPLNVSEVVFTDCRISLVYVRADHLDGPNLGLGYAAA
jgi:hypothetical protein